MCQLRTGERERKRQRERDRERERERERDAERQRHRERNLASTKEVIFHCATPQTHTSIFDFWFAL